MNRICSCFGYSEESAKEHVRRTKDCFLQQFRALDLTQALETQKRLYRAVELWDDGVQKKEEKKFVHFMERNGYLANISVSAFATAIVVAIVVSPIVGAILLAFSFASFCALAIKKLPIRTEFAAQALQKRINELRESALKSGSAVQPTLKI